MNDPTDGLRQEWQAALLADAAGRVDTAAAVVADLLLHVGWDDQLAGVVVLLERVAGDLARLRTELDGDGRPPIHTRSRPAWVNAA